MRIGIAADHGGFAMKERMKVALKSAGHDDARFSGAERHCRRLAKIAELERKVKTP